MSEKPLPSSALLGAIIMLAWLAWLFLTDRWEKGAREGTRFPKPTNELENESIATRRGRAGTDRRVGVNPYAGATTFCDRCSGIVRIENTFLLCPDCRKKYLDLMFKLRLRAPFERLWLACRGIARRVSGWAGDW